MPGSPLPRRECESRPLRVGFAFGAPRSARSRRNGLETLEGYKGGLLTHSECSGLPPRCPLCCGWALTPGWPAPALCLAAWRPPGGRPASCPSSGAVLVSR